MNTSSNKPRWTPSRIAYYVLAATLPPFMLGIILTFAVLKDLMIPSPPGPLPEEARASIPALPAKFAQPVALILLGTGGVQGTEVLATAAVLSRSRRFEVVTAALQRDLVRSTAGVEFQPHVTFADAPAPELLVIPSWIGEPSPEELRFIQAQAEKARWVLALGDGSRILASAGFLGEKEATSHPAGRDTLERSFPKVRWVWERSFVRDGKWITSGGVFQSVPGALEAVRSAGGPPLAAQTANSIGWNGRDTAVSSEAASVRWADWIPMILHGGYAWGRTSVGILLSPGLDDLDLAAAADPYPRTLSARTVILAAERRVLKTEAGLLVVPNIAVTQAPPLDEIIVPSHTGTLTNADEASQAWIEQQRLSTRVQTLPTSFSESLRFVFDHLGNTEGAWIAGFAARMTRYSWSGGSTFSGRVVHLLLRVLFISLVGVSVAWFMERRVRAKYAQVR